MEEELGLSPQWFSLSPSSPFALISKPAFYLDVKVARGLVISSLTPRHMSLILLSNCLRLGSKRRNIVFTHWMWSEIQCRANSIFKAEFRDLSLGPNPPRMWLSSSISVLPCRTSTEDSFSLLKSAKHEGFQVVTAADLQTDYTQYKFNSIQSIEITTTTDSHRVRLKTWTLSYSRRINPAKHLVSRSCGLIPQDWKVYLTQGAFSRRFLSIL